ncbi:MAG: rhomboid family intramembrane serine protease [Candidatus Dormibacteraeota bacterium]|nr:rhomboid family intramembrane serine protease [Candidatus Dormibacteraeota bacterium]
MTEAAPPPPPTLGLPPQPPALARAVALDLVTRFQLRLTDPRDSRLGELGGEMYELGAASWTGRRAVFVGFYTPAQDPAAAGPDLAARCAAAARWGADRLGVQGAERCDVLIVALRLVPGVLTAPASNVAVHVGAVAVDPSSGEVSVLLPPPADLPTPRDIRTHATALLGAQEAPTLAAVDLAERQSVAGGYAAPARTQLNTRPLATYSLIAAFVVVFIVEKVLLRNGSGDGLFDMGALSNLQPDWWRFISYAFLHDPGGGGTGASVLPLHVVFNSFAMYIVGRLVEQLFGWRLLVATFMVGAAGAGLASVLVATVTNGVALTVGASGGIMALLGLLFVLGRVQGRDVPVGIAHAMRQYALTYGAMVVVFGFVVPNVDNVAHIGGFITGALVGLALPPLRRVGGRDLKTWEQAVVYGVYAVAAVALVLAAINVVSLLGSSPGFTTAPL